MNYFLPIHCGAPDYFKYLNIFLNNFYFFSTNHNKNIESDFNLPVNKDLKNLGPYLAGLFEGDGHIILAKKKLSGRINYPYIAITFVNKDLPLINKLIEL